MDGAYHAELRQGMNMAKKDSPPWSVRFGVALRNQPIRAAGRTELSEAYI